MFRHLPPTATPLGIITLLHALNPSADAVGQFRRQFAAYVGAPTCFTASSGRTALFLLMQCLAETNPTRAEVVLPAYTCPSLVTVIQECGLAAVPVDLCPDTLEVVTDELERAVGRKTLVVLHVHPFGLPQPIQRVNEIAHAAGAVVIEDVAQSMGARLDGVYAGTRGDYGLYSLGPGKPLSAGGGGIVTVNSERNIEMVSTAWRTLPTAGRRDELLAVGRLTAFKAALAPRGWWLATKAGAQRVGDDEANWGFRRTGLTAAQATVAGEQLPHLEEYNAVRRRNAQAIVDGLQGVSGFTLPLSQAPEAESIYLRLPLVFQRSETCAKLHNALQGAGIGAGRMYKQALPNLFSDMQSYPGSEVAAVFPGAQAIAEGLLTLPTHHYLTTRDIDLIVHTIRRTSG